MCLSKYKQCEGKICVSIGETCNFKEKASVFEKRFDKKEANRIMKKMQKEAEKQEAEDNPFAALLGKIK